MDRAATSAPCAMFLGAAVAHCAIVKPFIRQDMDIDRNSEQGEGSHQQCSIFGSGDRANEAGDSS